jgi:hypothetical protein
MPELRPHILVGKVDEFAKSRFSATEVTEDSEKYHIFQDVNSVISVSSVAKIALLQLHHTSRKR